MNNSKAPNVKAPRFRSKIERTVNSELYADIRKNVSSAKSITDDQIKKIIVGFNECLWNNVINVRDGIEIPNQLGHIFIGTCPKKRRPNIDFKRTGEMNTIIQHRNWESDNFLAKIFFTSYGTRYSFRHKELWIFKPTRRFTREVGRTYPKNWKRYVQVDPMKKLSTIFRKTKEKVEAKAIVIDNLDSYNEFEI